MKFRFNCELEADPSEFAAALMVIEGSSEDSLAPSLMKIAIAALTGIVPNNADSEKLDDEITIMGNDN